MSKRTKRSVGEKPNNKRTRKQSDVQELVDRDGDNEQIAEETDVRNLILNQKVQKKSPPVAVKKVEEEPMRRGVVYLGHIPRGFFEPQMKRFFSQFGKITRLRLARNARTGQSKGYAFIEFECDEVAQIVAETINNYIMFGRVLKCQVLPAEKQHPGLWRGANRKGVNTIPYQFLASLKANKTRTEEEQKKRLAHLLQNEKKKREKLAALNIEYDFPGYHSLGKTKQQQQQQQQQLPKTKAKRIPSTLPPSSLSTSKKRK